MALLPGPRFAVHIGEKMVDFSEDFKLFMTTRNPNLEVSPDAIAIVTAVNFTTTRAGLTSQVHRTYSPCHEMTGLLQYHWLAC